MSSVSDLMRYAICLKGSKERKAISTILFIFSLIISVSLTVCTFEMLNYKKLTVSMLHQT